MNKSGFRLGMILGASALLLLGCTNSKDESSEVGDNSLEVVSEETLKYCNVSKMLGVTCDGSCDDYEGYGCWCSEIAQKGPPVDDADECCRVWQYCRDEIFDAFGIPVEEYHGIPYNWIGTADGMIHCDPGNVGIGQAACDCDSMVAMCLAQYPLPDEIPQCIPWPEPAGPVVK